MIIYRPLKGVTVGGWSVLTAFFLLAGLSTLCAQPLLQEWQKNQKPEFSSQKPAWSTNPFTRLEERKRAGEFRKHLWLEGYKANADRSRACDAEIVQLMETWLAVTFGDQAHRPTNFAAWCDRLLARPDCDDPLFIAFSSLHASNPMEKLARVQKALAGFPRSRHRAYVRFHAQASLLDMTGMPDQVEPALQAMKDCFSDGSFRPQDQAEIAEIFLGMGGWGQTFFFRMPERLFPIVQAAGKDFEWLALVLEGEHWHFQAWQVRGGGFANTVSEAAMKGFATNLLSARRCFTRAWELKPNLVMAPTRMISVAMGTTGAEEMLVWFDRALTAQIDYPRAWEEMRWGLKSRWHGDPELQLALGRLALNTGRFDTDVPRKFMDFLGDLEADLGGNLGRGLYGQTNIWLEIKKMFEGYLAQPAMGPLWHSGFAVAAYLAGQYEVARKQLEAIEWKPVSSHLSERGRNLELMPLEVAARTGSLGAKVTAAEAKAEAGEISEALKAYEAMSQLPTAGDRRSAQYIQHRTAALRVEQQLAKGDWVDFLPRIPNDPAWNFSAGAFRRSTNGIAEIESNQLGHLLYCRAPVGMDFEVRGAFSLGRSSNFDYEAGVVFGIPSLESGNWASFRMRHRLYQRDRADLAQEWDLNQALSDIRLVKGTNTFQMRVQDLEVTATVNGREVFKDQPVPGELMIPESGFMVGLGASSNTNRTTIRIHQFQVKRIKSEP